MPDSMDPQPLQCLMGTAYFALQEDAHFLQQLAEGLRLYGSNQPVSRLNRLPAFAVLDQVETSLAQHLDVESACLFSSGFLAGIAVRRRMLDLAREAGWLLLSSEDCHPCLAPLAASAGIAKTGARILNQLSSKKMGSWVALCNSADIFQGRPAPALADPIFLRAAWRVLDVSHTIFIWDHRELLQSINRDRTLMVGSLGKAGAFPAGFAAGPAEMIESLRRGEIFNAASPPPVAHAHAFLAAEGLRRRRRSHLHRLMARADALWGIDRPARRRFPAYPLIPADERVHQDLRMHGFNLSYLSYPSPATPKSLRMVLNAGIPETALTHLAELLSARGIHLAQRPPRPVHWRMPR